MEDYKLLGRVEQSIIFEIAFGLELLIANLWIIASWFMTDNTKRLILIIMGIFWLVLAGFRLNKRWIQINREIKQIEHDIERLFAEEERKGFNIKDMKGGKRK